MSSLDNIWKDKRLSLSIKLRVYLALVQSALLYASETWTLTVADSKSLDAFHMKCQRRILEISWHQFVWNEEVAALTGFSSLSDIICRRRSAIFGHIARFGEEVPAHKALRNCISLSLGRLPDLSWRRRPGRPRGRWIDSSEEITVSHPPTYRDRLSTAVTVEERRNGLRTMRLPDLTWPALNALRCMDSSAFECNASNRKSYTIYRTA